MLSMEVDPNSRATRGILEILAYDTNALLSYSSYRLLILYSIRPDIHRRLYRRYGNRYPFSHIDNRQALQESLTRELTTTVRYATQELGFHREQELIPEQVELLALYCGYIGAASMSIKGAFLDAEPALRTLQNPLTDVDMVQRIWRHRLGMEQDYPPLTTLIRSDFIRIED